jgi:hypothetical protein
LNNNRFQKEKRKERLEAIEVKLKTSGLSFLDTLNPIHSDIPSLEKIIRLITIVFSGIFIIQVLSEFSTITDYTQDLVRFPLVGFLVLFPFILLPVGILTFCKRKSLGWILLAIYLTFSIVGILWVLLNPSYWRQSSSAITEKLFPGPSSVSYLFQLLFLLAILYTICKYNVREAFLITQNKMTKAIVMSGISTFILLIFS